MVVWREAPDRGAKAARQPRVVTTRATIQRSDGYEPPAQILDFRLDGKPLDEYPQSLHNSWHQNG